MDCCRFFGQRRTAVAPVLVSHHPVDQLLTSAIMSWATCSALFQPPSRECSALGQLQLSVERMNLSALSTLWDLRHDPMDRVHPGKKNAF